MYKIYTTTTCPKCQSLKGLFKENNIPYEEVNIEEDFVARAKLLENDIYQVPALEIDGNLKSGEVSDLANYANIKVGAF